MPADPTPMERAEREARMHQRETGGHWIRWSQSPAWFCDDCSKTYPPKGDDRG